VVAVIPRSPPSRILVIVAAASFAVIVAAYALAAPDARARSVIADLSGTWTALYATACCVFAARRHPDPMQRAAWSWIAAGCAVYLAGQLVWNYYELVRQVRPPYPSLADAGYLGIYACFLVAIVRLVSAQPRRRFDPELLLDTVLVTVIAATLAYEFLLQRLFAAGGALAPLLTSVAWSVSGVVVLWLLLVALLRATSVPLATFGFAIAGLALVCVTNVVYAAASLRGAFQSGGPLSLGWDAGFLLLAVAAAIAPSRAATPRASTPVISGHAARIAAVVLGVAGVAAVGLQLALSPRRDPPAAVMIAAAGAILVARFIHTLRAGRRYTALLENEVASQTRSLMDSLAATAIAERNVRLVMDAVPDAIAVLDRDGRIVEANEPAAAMVALSGASLTGRSVFDFLDAATATLVRERIAAAFRGAVQRFETPFVRGDGTRGTAALQYAPVRDGSRVLRVLALARDVTDQKRTEAQLQQAEKLTAMGQLVSGVAHEINNPAAIISGFAQTLLLDDLKPEHREMLQMVCDEATRIGRITSNLLAFARAGGTQRTLVDLNDIVRRTFSLRSYHLSTLNIAVSLELDANDPKIWADASELQQLLLNLLINAEQALVEGEGARTITVRTRADDREAVLEIADSGPGIPAEIRRKIFDPFFTTKPEGVGTGLGLSICYGIAREHGGRIWVDSEVGQGACFSVALPRDPRQEVRASVEPPAAALATGALTVLVVDDETSLRNALLRFLTRRGIHAQGASDGAEALRLLRRREFDVIISDVRMPGMSGREFLETLRRERPELVPRLVFSTGDTYAPETAALLKESGAPTVTKPFDFTALERVIREVAAASRLTSPAQPDPRIA
jgi:PAS domain S-box-containing protein